jgi:hypothetical protein
LVVRIITSLARAVPKPVRAVDRAGLPQVARQVVRQVVAEAAFL